MRISDWSSDVCSSDLTDAGHIARQHGLHDETLDRADEQRGCGIRIEVRMQFALCLPGFEQATQPFAIVEDQGMGHALRESLARSLQLPEQHSRPPGMIRPELDIRTESPPKGNGRPCSFFPSLVHP